MQTAVEGLDRALTMAALVSVTLCLAYLASGLIPRRRPRSLAVAAISPAPSWLARTLSGLGFALALSSPAAAQSQSPVSPNRSDDSPAATAPWSESGGFPPPSPLDPTGSLLVDGAIADEPVLEDEGLVLEDEGPILEDDEPTLEDEVSSHPALHGRRPAGSVTPLFPRTIDPSRNGIASRERAVEEFFKDPGAELERARLEKAESMRRHPAGKALDGDVGGGRPPVGKSSSREDRSSNTPKVAAASRSGDSSVASTSRKTTEVAIHVVQPGDTLWGIAGAQLKTDDIRRIARHWPKIHKLNRSVVGADPSLIYPGQVLELPLEQDR